MMVILLDGLAKVSTSSNEDLGSWDRCASVFVLYVGHFNTVAWRMDSELITQPYEFKHSTTSHKYGYTTDRLIPEH